MTIPPILKNKWVLIGGGLVILIVLFMSGGKSSTASGAGVTASGPTDAEIAAQHDIAIAQLNAQAQTTQGNLQLAAIQQSGQIDLAKAQIDAQLQQYQIDAQSAVASLQLSTNREIQLADIASSDRQSQAAITSQSQIAKWTLDQATANAQIQTDFQLQYAENANTTQVSLAQMQAQLVNNQLAANRDVTLAGLASQEQMAAINAQLQLNTTYSNNQTTQAVIASTMNSTTEQARIAAAAQTEQTRLITGAQKSASTGSTIGSIVGSVAGALGFIFSDPRLKRDIVPLGTRPDDGLGLYRYRYIGDDMEQLGVMADEVEFIRPDALGPKLLGFRTVDYAAL